MAFGDRIKRSWNAFFNRDPTLDDIPKYKFDFSSTSYRPDRFTLTPTNGRTMVADIYNRIALDVSQISIIHARLDQNGRYTETLNTDLNKALTLEANLDQTGKAFIQDVALSMFDEGCVAVVPVDTSSNPITGSYKIYTLRVGKIVQWYPDRVRVELYNERTGKKQQINCWKSSTAIIENPFYAVMNASNGTLKRLISKMNLLDKLDRNAASGKLDLILQLPYIVKTESRKKQAQARRQELYDQLHNSEYGIAYTDGTEKIVQLNRTITNNLPEEIDKLQAQLYNQLGLTEEIFKGTASAEVMTNYYNRTVEPVLDAICDEFTRKFLTSTARTQGQCVMYYRDPFKLSTVAEIGEVANNLIPNQIVTSNEIRTAIGLKPSDQPQADQLINPNINTVDGMNGMAGDTDAQLPPEEGYDYSMPEATDESSQQPVDYE